MKQWIKKGLSLLGVMAILLTMIPMTGLVMAEEASEILFQDDFSDATVSQSEWTTTTDTWIVQDGVYAQSSASGGAITYTGNADWTDYEVSVDITIAESPKNYVMLIGRMQDLQNRYIVTFDGTVLKVDRRVDGADTQLGKSSLTLKVDTTYTVKAQFKGNKILVYVNDVLKLQVSDSAYTGGQVGLACFDTQATFDNVVVRSVPDFTGDSVIYPMDDLTYTTSIDGMEAIVGNTAYALKQEGETTSTRLTFNADSTYWVEFTLPVEQAGVYKISAQTYTHVNRAKYQAYWNDEALGGVFNQLAASGVNTNIDDAGRVVTDTYGTVSISEPGQAKVKFQVVDKGSTVSTGGYAMAFCNLILTPADEDVPGDTTTPADQMAMIQQKLTDNFLLSDSFYDGANNGTCYTSKAGDYLAIQNENGSWSDVDYYCNESAANGGVWEPYLALDRMQAMAMAYTKPDGAWYHDPEMLQGVENALIYWASIQGNPDDPSHVGPWSTNWWENSNGVAKRFSRIGVVLRGVLSQEAVNIILPELDQNGSTNAGQNALWQTQNALYRALIANDATKFKQVVDTNLAVNLRVGGLEDEAIQVDNTFHCHGNQLYTNGYGKTLFQDMAFWIDTLAGTDFAVPQSVIDLMADYMLGGTRWMIRGGLLEIADGYKGSGNSATGYIKPLQLMIKNDPANAAEYQKVLDSITGDSGTTYNGANGNNYMWTSALMSHMREGYGVNVRMNHKGMKSTEWRATWPGNDYGNLIFWTADATASVMIDGDEYISVYDTYDWRHIPGVTAPFALASHYGFDNDVNDAWGVTDGTYGATAYTFYKHDGTNKRTWGKIGYFFFDDEYVALGAGIGSDHAQAIHTTMNQTKAANVSVNGAAVADGTDDVTYQADYVYNNKIGYVFPETTEVHVSNLNHTDKKYPTVRGTGYSSTTGDVYGKTTESTFSLWMDHGVAPDDSSYAYIVVPNTTEEELAAYSENNQIIIVANTETVQAVRHEGLKQTQINFYEAGTLEYAPGKVVSVDAACSIIIDESGSEPVISQAISNTKSATLVNVVLTVGETNTVTEFCSLDTPYAGKSITQVAGGSSLMQSSSVSSEHSTARAFDQNLETYWESNADENWISYDMRESLYVGNMIFRWGDAYATKYELQYSEDGVTWTTAYTQNNGQGGTEVVPYNAIGRYWRLRCLESSGDSYQIKEITFQTSTNIALNKTCATNYDYRSDLAGKYAIDGNKSTRWAGDRGKDNNWIIVNVGAKSRLDGVRIFWEAAYASKYTIDVSDDKMTWKTVSTVTCSGGTVQTALPTGTIGQYLRVQSVKAATGYGVSIWELEIYGALQMEDNNTAVEKPVTDAAGESVTTVTDDKTDTVWNTSNATDSLTVDLGENHQVDSVSVTWGDRHATQYIWQLSFNGTTWSDAAAVVGGSGGTETAVVAARGRYVRLLMNQSSADGYDVAEINVYGAALADLNPDKSALKAAIDTRVRNDVYTTDTYQAYQTALMVATDVYVSPKATKKMVEDATTGLLAAIEELEFRDFGEVLVTLPTMTAAKTTDTGYLNTGWKSLSQTLDLSEDNLSEIYFFALVDITRNPNEEGLGMFGNGRLQLRSPFTTVDGKNQENYAWVNVNTLDLQLGQTVVYFPLSNLIGQVGTMDWSQVKEFGFYIDSVNKFAGTMNLTISDAKIIRTTELPKVKVACVGDSITAGNGSSSTSMNYVSQLQSLLGSRYTVQNFGNSGKTLLKEDANAYILTDTYTNSVAFEPDVVTIMLGTNDSKDAIWDAYGDKYEQELRDLINVYRNLPSKPIVILATSPTAYNRNWTINDAVVTGEIAPIQRRVAEEMGCPLIETNANTKDMADKFADGIHPNDAGYTVLADLFADGVTEASTRIYSFELAGENATIDHENNTIAVTLPADTDLTALTPTLQLMQSATVSPSGKADYTNSVTLTVTSPDGVTTREYMVTVTKETQTVTVDKTELEEALTGIVTDLSGYTVATANAYTEAVANAQAVMNDVDATQEQVDNALQGLTDAEEALVAIVLGDVDGKDGITAADALMALQAATSKIQLTADQTTAANVDKANGVTAGDALLILQFATQKISSF